MLEEIIEDIMAGKKVSLVVKSMDGEELRKLEIALRLTDVKVILSSYTLRTGGCKITFHIPKIEQERGYSDVVTVLKKTPLKIQRLQPT